MTPAWAVGFRRWQWRFCALGALLGVGIYAARTTRLPRRTEMGVERRLFNTGNVPFKLLQSPGGEQWVVTLELPAGTPTVLPGGPVLPALFADSRPLLSSNGEGSWLLDGGALRWVWRHPAFGWSDETHLWGSPDNSYYGSDTLFLDLRTGLSRQRPNRPAGLREPVEDGEGSLYGTTPAGFSEPLDPDNSLRQALSAGTVQWFPVGTRTIGFLAQEDGASPIYGVSDDPTPRTLWLCSRGKPVGLSRDGRRLFFERDAALWRLDLREPLPVLLDRQSPPPITLPKELGIP